ncbi:hypothetical protein SPONN_1020 [uncultured Candidatus Thioglobus sp.]|nr:hypothetical protein SPONN_1020 [uncultured Candidatus Thioglobus sp.]
MVRTRDDDNRKCDIPDHIACKMVNCLPTVCNMISDSKNINMEEGELQIVAYMRSLQPEYLSLGMVITKSRLLLQLFIPFDGKFSVITICSASCYSIDELKRFFSALYAAISRLLDPISTTPLTHAVTLRCCSQEIVCLHKDETHKNLGSDLSLTSNASIVIHCTTRNFVRKYYDLEFNYIPPADVIALIPGAIFLNKLDGRFQILEYPYLEGSNQLQSQDQVVAAIQALNKFHAKGYVHGDIRECNMIVCVDRVCFIDIDLTRKEGEAYVSTYNHANISERHEDAKKNKPMKKIHDRYALDHIIKRNSELFSPEALLDISKSLQSIASSM